jgi:hypothetical protein
LFGVISTHLTEEKTKQGKHTHTHTHVNVDGQNKTPTLPSEGTKAGEARTEEREREKRRKGWLTKHIKENPSCARNKDEYTHTHTKI